jgi:hypothetical protein
MKRKLAFILPALIISSFAFGNEGHSEKGSFSKEMKKNIEFSVDYWIAYPSGNLKIGAKKITKKEDLDFEKAKDFGGKILFKGEDYNLPNIVFTYTPIEYEGEGIAKRDMEFKGLTIDEGKEFKAKEETVNYDIGALWDIGHLKEITEDRLDIRAGISLRYIDYSFELESEGNQRKVNDHKIIPMFDVEAEVEVLPLNQNITTEIILELQSYVWDGKFAFDFIDSIRVNYQRIFAEAGYRVFKSKLDYDNVISKANGAGGFLSIGVMF